MDHAIRYALLDHALKAEGEQGVTPAIRAAIDALGLIHVDESDGHAAVDHFHAEIGDERIELEHVDLGFGGHSFSLRRFKMVDETSLNYGALLLT